MVLVLVSEMLVFAEIASKSGLYVPAVKSPSTIPEDKPAPRPEVSFPRKATAPQNKVRVESLRQGLA